MLRIFRSISFVTVYFCASLSLVLAQLTYIEYPLECDPNVLQLGDDTASSADDDASSGAAESSMGAESSGSYSSQFSLSTSSVSSEGASSLCDWMCDCGGDKGTVCMLRDEIECCENYGGVATCRYAMGNCMKNCVLKSSSADPMTPISLHSSSAQSSSL